MLFYLFDVMHLDGFDLSAARLLDRKRVLAGLLGGVGPPIVYSEHMEVDGSAMFEHACKLHLLGEAHDLSWRIRSARGSGVRDAGRGLSPFISSLHRMATASDREERMAPSPR